MTPHESARAIDDALRDLPLLDRMSALVCSIIADDLRAAIAVANIVSVAAIMARHSASRALGDRVALA